MADQREPERYRHKKRGTTYAVLGIASAQVVGEPICEGMEAVVYRSDDDGSLWLRPKDEFFDGRFERLPPSAVPSQPQQQDLVAASVFEAEPGQPERIPVTLAERDLELLDLAKAKAWRDGFDAGVRAAENIGGLAPSAGPST